MLLAMSRRPPTVLVVLALALALGLLGARRPPRDPALEAQLRARAELLFEQRERARDAAGFPVDRLQRDLIALADSLSAAGLDTLASWTRYRAAGVLKRMSRQPEAERQLTLAIADALRARDQDAELAARGLLLDWVGNDRPEESLVAARGLARRLVARRDTLRLAEIDHSRARILGGIGRWRESLAAAKEAATGYALTRHMRAHVVSLGLCSQALRFLGRHAEALAFADSAVRIGRRLGYEDALSRALVERSSLLRRAGRLDEALESIDEALAIDRRIRDSSHEPFTRMFRTTVLRQAGRYEDALREAREVLELPRTREDPASQLRAVAAYAGLLATLRRTAEADTLLERAVARYERYVATLDSEEDRASARAHAYVAYTTWAYCRLQRHGPEEALRTLERGRALELKARLGMAGGLGLAPLLERLRARRAALVTYLETIDAPAIALLLAEGRVRSISMTGAPAPDDARIAMTLLSSRGDPGATRQALARLARAWFDDLAGEIPAGTRRLVIVPPYDLPSFPFEALPLAGDAAGATVGDRWAVSYLPCAAVMGVLAAQPAARGPVVAFADPATRGLPRLGAARDEARAATRGAGRTYAGRAATFGRLEDLAGQASVLHFATHAVVDPKHPDRSGLRLADPGGLVTVARVESLSVAADLVVLSGCRTAYGPELLGEGAFGLARAFLASGARSVVTTLWDVDDRRSSQVMAAFYEGLRAGLAPDESLRRARRRLPAASTSSRDRWTFVLVGLGDEPVAALAGGRSGGLTQ